MPPELSIYRAAGNSPVAIAFSLWRPYPNAIPFKHPAIFCRLTRISPHYGKGKRRWPSQSISTKREKGCGNSKNRRKRRLTEQNLAAIRRPRKPKTWNVPAGNANSTATNGPTIRHEGHETANALIIDPPPHVRGHLFQQCVLRLHRVFVLDDPQQDIVAPGIDHR